MARSSQTAQTQPSQEPSPTPSPAPQERPVSLVGPPAQVPERLPYEDIVINYVEASPVVQPGPEPVATFGDDGSITIN